MPEPDDIELLSQYAESHSEAAFATLVARHANLVYSAALRQTGNPHHAEEISQAVFIILARKAGTLSRRTILSGWLYHTARLTAANFLRAEFRRARREQEAHMQTSLNEPGAAAWPQIAPLLDAAMGALGEQDRNAIVLRYFENKSAREMAAALRTSESTAQKRLTRAMEKLRAFFTKRGVVLPVAVLTTAISAHSVQAAPVALAKSVTAIALAKGATVSGPILALVKGTMKTMTWLKTTTFAVILANAFVSQQIIATHFDLAGRPNGWMTHSNFMLLGLVVGCGLPLFIMASGYLLRFLPVNWINLPNRDYWLASEQGNETFDYVFHHLLRLACLEAILMLTLQLLVVQANHQTPPHLSPLADWAGGCFLVATAIWFGVLIRHFKHVPAAP